MCICINIYAYACFIIHVHVSPKKKKTVHRCAQTIFRQCMLNQVTVAGADNMLHISPSCICVSISTYAHRTKGNGGGQWGENGEGLVQIHKFMEVWAKLSNLCTNFLPEGPYLFGGGKRRPLFVKRFMKEGGGLHFGPLYLGSTLQHSATHCNTLQHTVTHCNTLQHTVTHCNTLHHRTDTFVHCTSVPHCNTLQHAATRCNTLQHRTYTCVHGTPVTCHASHLFVCGGGRVNIHEFYLLFQDTGCRKYTGCLKLQVSFRQKATNYRPLLRKLNNKDKVSYASSPPCSIWSGFVLCIVSSNSKFL